MKDKNRYKLVFWIGVVTLTAGISLRFSEGTALIFFGAIALLLGIAAIAAEESDEVREN